MWCPTSFSLTDVLKLLAIVIHMWAGLCQKGPYGCGRGFEISRDKVQSIKMMMKYDDETLIACCAMMTHFSHLWSASFESHCAEVSCSFWFIEIGCCLAKLRLFQALASSFWQAQSEQSHVKVGCTKTLITQRRNKIFTNGFQLCNLEIMGYKKCKKNRKLTKNAIRSLFA